MNRFYCPNLDLSSPTIFITDREELHHLSNVLRLKESDKIEIFDGRGLSAIGTITAITSAKVTVAIDSYLDKSNEKSVTLILACAIPKKTKFELIIEKATELGVDEIIPLKTERTENALKDEKLEKKLKRYETIAINAAKQSKRNTIPKIHNLTNFNQALDYLLASSTVIMPSLSGKCVNLIRAFEANKDKSKISFLIGPEGDFSPKEYSLAHARGCIPVSLGKNVLKVETAAITALACANIYFDNE